MDQLDTLVVRSLLDQNGVRRFTLALKKKAHFFACVSEFPVASLLFSYLFIYPPIDQAVGIVLKKHLCYVDSQKPGRVLNGFASSLR